MSKNELGTGIYENLIYQALRKKIDSLDDSRYRVYEDSAENVMGDDATKLMASHLSSIIGSILSDDRMFQNGLSDKIRFVNEVIEYIDKEYECDYSDEILEESGKILQAVLLKEGHTEDQLGRIALLRPKSGFTQSSLFTGNNMGLSIDQEIRLDILSADRIYWIIAFIKFAGIRIFEDSLKSFFEKPGAEMYLITTTYMGASDARAVEFLKNLAPDKVHIKVSYDTENSRLHAKSYIFLRSSGLNTAYIGSSNISRSALTTGLEWNVRVTDRQNHSVIEAAKATFETYWHRPEFEDYDSEKFRKALGDYSSRFNEEGIYHSYIIRPEQKEILEKLSLERDENVHDSHRNLVVAATGTGKTAISAFDYKRFCRGRPQDHNLLFIAHREEILKQAIWTFRSVLGDSSFGELWVGHYQPSTSGNIRHLFMSISMFNNNTDIFRNMDPGFYEYIVIDEAHHSVARSYRDLFRIFTPKILLGLTATPERADGQSLLPDFNNRIAAEIRLPEAINRMLLSPFQYFCIGDGIDLRNVTWVGSTYSEDELSHVLNTKARMEVITQSIQHYLTDPGKCKALCFCVNRPHAKDTARYLGELGYKADSLDGTDNREHRENVVKKLRNGEINYLCVVDIFNEGVDIPEVDTCLFLRPTKSLTVFLQQLGRGLRLSENKECLTVLDFVSQARKEYDFASRFKALTGDARTPIQKQIEQNVFLLPRGCALNMDRLSQNYVLENIRSAIYNKRKILSEIRVASANGESLMLNDFLDSRDLNIGAVYKVACWTALKREAGVITYETNEDTRCFESNMRRLIQASSLGYMNFILKMIEKGFEYSEESSEESTYALMLYYDLYAKALPKTSFQSIGAALRKFGEYEVFVDELRGIVLWLKNHMQVVSRKMEGLGYESVLELFGRYTREQLLVIFGKRTAQKASAVPMGGIMSVEDRNTELLWVTLNKSDKDFSPSTQYKDLALDENLFQWQSQNSASHAGSGKRYVEQPTSHRRIILFVRENTSDAYDLTEAYYCLGTVQYKDSYGDKPMTITWKMDNPIPSFILDKAQKLAVG